MTLRTRVGGGQPRYLLEPHHDVLAVTLYFVLGFMTKFVAVLFLPLVLAVATLLIPEYRKKVRENWLLWVGAKILAIALCAPWFIYSQIRFGSQLWETILGEHVFRRMTGFLDPTHVHPWSWYIQSMWQEFVNERMQWLIAAGLLSVLIFPLVALALLGRDGEEGALRAEGASSASS